eukprot:scaffold248396_cov65-Cyclotella_meneghiniana.AAC.2
MDDDLDAFFDDVETAVKEVQQEEAEKPASNTNDVDEERPPKRIKVTSQQSQPVKAVVASSVPVKSIVAAVPPPPPSSTTNKAVHSVSHIGQPVEAQTNNNILPAPPTNNNTNNINNTSSKPHIRSAAGQTWTDPTLTQWPENDFRLFVGNLPKDLKQHQLEAAFAKYPSFQMARIIYDKPKVIKPGMNEEGISRGYGFVSVLDPKDCARAIREMDQSWLGSRPIKVKRSEWKEREWKEVKKRDKFEKRKGKGKNRGFGL